MEKPCNAFPNDKAINYFLLGGSNLLPIVCINIFILICTLSKNTISSIMHTFQATNKTTIILNKYLYSFSNVTFHSRIVWKDLYFGEIKSQIKILLGFST